MNFLLFFNRFFSILTFFYPPPHTICGCCNHWHSQKQESCDKTNFPEKSH